MRKFVIKLSTYAFCILLAHLAALLYFPKNQDPFYNRFTSNKQEMLVIGSSRSAQGIIPTVIHQKIRDLELYNFSFTKSTSPFGPIYLDAIKKKLKTSNASEKRVFIIEVNPWTLATTNEHLEVMDFMENNGMLAQIPLINLNPNPFYFLSQYDKGWGNLFLTKPDSTFHLHKDGWLEVSIDYDSIQIALNTRSKIEDYRRDELKRSIKSEVRLSFLKETIDYFLSLEGQVFLTRLPIHKDLLAIENEFYDNFDEEMLYLTNKDVHYLNFVNDDHMLFNDGNHLNKKSSKLFSMKLADSIDHILKKEINE